MYLEELFELTIWFNKEVINAKVINKYTQLHAKLNQNAQNTSVAYDNERTSLFKSLKVIDINILSDEQRKFLEKINVYNKIGNLGVKEIENILFRNSLDIKTATIKLKELIDELTNGINRINNINHGLKDVVQVEEKIKDKAIIRVHFDNDASIKNITNLKEWSNDWYDISRGIAMIHNEAPEIIEVVGVKKGSIIVELVSIGAIVCTVSKIIYEVLKVIEKVYDIRKKAEEIKSLKLKNEKIAQDLEEEANHVQEIEIENIVDLIVSGVENTDGDKKNALRKTINNIFIFMNKGGEIDLCLPQETDVDNEEIKKTLSELKDKFKEINTIKNKIKQLENN